MRKLFMIFAMILSISSICMSTIAGDQPHAMKKGTFLADHLSELKKYEKSTPFSGIERNPSTSVMTEAAIWKVGDGFLVVECTIGAGIITNITYVIYSEKDKQQITLNVKDVDLTKNEMTIILPNRATLGKPD